MNLNLITITYIYAVWLVPTCICFQTQLFADHGIKSETQKHKTRVFSTATDTEFKAPQIEIDRRRNLAIISHPDSGKTTMTEKLLLYGGAIQQAGAVRMKAEQRGTASDFMEMEKERGISIRYAFGCHVNLSVTINFCLF